MDLVVWPGMLAAYSLLCLYDCYPVYLVLSGCHDDVEAIVKLAVKYNICIIPFGGQ